jgi:hypothetical protein
MKTIDITAYTVIKEGVEICVAAKTQGPMDGLLPVMERNEGAVYWLQPKGGTVEQQEACICVNGTFYMLNSKFEKAIFRSVRLTRDFQNYERLVDGTRKLVIPRRLFQEKLRTSRRVSLQLRIAHAHTPVPTCVCAALTLWYFRRTRHLCSDCQPSLVRSMYITTRRNRRKSSLKSLTRKMPSAPTQHKRLRKSAERQRTASARHSASVAFCDKKHFKLCSFKSAGALSNIGAALRF